MMTDERARLFVVLADQIGSRRGADRVPQALDLLTEAVGERMLLGFERTAGDEVQGLTADPGSVVDCVVALTRLGRWRLGIGVGTVDHPLPASTRAARGEAYLAARSAIEAARTSPTALALVAGGSVGGAPYPDDMVRERVDVRGRTDVGARIGVDDAEAALWLLRSVLSRRTDQGWEVSDLLDQGLANKQVAAQLGISPSAVSQRSIRAAHEEARRGRVLCTHLLGRLVQPEEG